MDLPEVGLGKLSNEEKRGIRNSQIEEFLGFFMNSHHATNVAIFTGDFNIDAHDQIAYDELKMRLCTEKTKFEDIWEKQRGDKGGYTDGDIGSICHYEQGESYCSDPAASGLNGSRWDYIFVEKPTETHTFNLDISRVRRRPFPRDNPTEGQLFMSDHLGLDVTLIVSPRV